MTDDPTTCDGCGEWFYRSELERVELPEIAPWAWCLECPECRGLS